MTFVEIQKKWKLRVVRVLTEHCERYSVNVPVAEDRPLNVDIWNTGASSLVSHNIWPKSPDELDKELEKFYSAGIEPTEEPEFVPGQLVHVKTLTESIDERVRLLEFQVPKPGDTLPFTVFENEKFLLFYNHQGYLDAKGIGEDAHKMYDADDFVDFLSIPRELSIVTLVTEQSEPLDLGEMPTLEPITETVREFRPATEDVVDPFANE